MSSRGTSLHISSLFSATGGVTAVRPLRGGPPRLWAYTGVGLKGALDTVSGTASRAPSSPRGIPGTLSSSGYMCLTTGSLFRLGLIDTTRRNTGFLGRGSTFRRPSGRAVRNRVLHLLYAPSLFFPKGLLMGLMNSIFGLALLSRLCAIIWVEIFVLLLGSESYSLLPGAFQFFRSAQEADHPPLILPPLIQAECAATPIFKTRGVNHVETHFAFHLGPLLVA